MQPKTSSCENCCRWLREDEDIGTCKLMPPVLDVLAIGQELKKEIQRADAYWPDFWVQPATRATDSCQQHVLWD